jgi:hypothetical protein
MTNTTAAHRRINDRITVLQADEVQVGMPVSLVTSRTMSFDPGIPSKPITAIFDGQNGYCVLAFGEASVTVPNDAEVWIKDPEGTYV